MCTPGYSSVSKSPVMSLYATQTQHNNGGRGGDGIPVYGVCQIWLPVICVQAFALLPGLAVLRSRSHDPSSDVIDWPIGGTNRAEQRRF